ncbi:hypothetical protein FQZ97_842500 [compost metagenome]
MRSRRCSGSGAACAAARSARARGGRTGGTARSRRSGRRAAGSAGAGRHSAASRDPARRGRCARRPGPRNAGRRRAGPRASRGCCRGDSRRAGGCTGCRLHRPACSRAAPGGLRSAPALLPARRSRRFAPRAQWRGGSAASRGARGRSRPHPMPGGPQRSAPRPRCGCAPGSDQSTPAPRSRPARAGVRRGAGSRKKQNHRSGAASGR